MKRVCILGNSGSGKSTLARALAEKLGVPTYHLDAVFWRPGWQEPERPEFNFRVRELALEDSWTLEGNYSDTLPFRLERADLAIVLDLPRWFCLCSVLQRWSANYNKTRADMAPGCPEKVDLEFIRWIWDGPKRTEKTLELLKDFPALEVRIFRSRGEAWKWLEDIRLQGMWLEPPQNL